MTASPPPLADDRRPPIRPYPIPTRRPIPRPWPAAFPPRRPVRRNRAALIALAMLTLIGAATLMAPLIAPADPMAVHLEAALRPPSRAHLAGTDMFGRDVMSRVLYGGRLTFSAAMIATIIAILPGTLLGLLAGYFGGVMDELISRLTDVILAIPYLLLALLIVAVIGPGIEGTALGVGLAGLPTAVRVVRSAVRQTRRMRYITAARAVGCTESRILIRHILPNIAGVIIVIATLQAGWAMLNASALSFLGLGAPPGVPEWGAMLNEGRLYLRQAPWIAAAPGIALTLTILAVNLIGDGLRDAADPRN
ncbi:MAG: ABC transporter permease [Anaerolineae bacterium]|nr:ABC transporter permease [Anaerolineae bacterium]MDW8100461.1 ABC transporter permease [Anaerolineae bacterium]